MNISMTCECGNTTGFFSAGEETEDRAEWVEIEDDDRFKLTTDARGLKVQCKFCSRIYVIASTDHP
ncbi:hypothetical protein SY83_18190 [Paenibacillus swuensis]|uniref:Uncharacterized protein n=1 Tax=Paenibacillus swuensis TaxID=1178515 RepID=A0A172TLJ2_9BACL|nr:hypothetical protein [Paenibacillus swuensis]ANE47900.1 hypothetical protein SY83_18190 [Paenibacillus swuensis]